MTEIEQLAAATLIAKLAHQGQKDKSGEPYIHHPMTVASYLEDPELKAIAMLHDTIEDTSVTYEDLLSVFGNNIADTVLCLTHQKEEDYFDYIRRVKKDPAARLVKLADIRHNMLPERNQNLDEKGRKRLEKYRIALKLLNGE